MLQGSCIRSEYNTEANNNSDNASARVSESKSKTDRVNRNRVPADCYPAFPAFYTHKLEYWSRLLRQQPDCVKQTKHFGL